MNNPRTSGAGGITVSMLNMTFKKITLNLWKTINCTIILHKLYCTINCLGGTLQSHWRFSQVMPVFKSGGRSELDTVRVISISHTYSKLTKWVMLNQQVTYLESEQHSFRPTLTTESVLLDAINYISENRDTCRSVSLVTTNTSKAFDSVEDGRLLEKQG